MQKKHILVVDDEVDIREILQFNLENAGYDVTPAASAEEALDILRPAQTSPDELPDLILLDVMMSGMSGYKMAEVVRKEYGMSIPIIFLTAKTSENDLLTGFSAGGDDYISKPFSIHEVLARIQAVLRRSVKVEEDENTIQAGDMQIDLKSKIVYVSGEAVMLSRKEFGILLLLASHPGKIYSREEIISSLWKDTPYVLDRTIDVHIARIRSKLGSAGNHIVNRSGFGYCFEIK